MIGQLRLKPAEMLAPLSQVGQGTQEMQFSYVFIYQAVCLYIIVYSILIYFNVFYSFIKLCIGTADVIHHFMICYWAICQPRFLVSKYVGGWSDCSTFIAYHCPMSWMSSLVAHILKLQCFLPFSVSNGYAIQTEKHLPLWPEMGCILNAKPLFGVRSLIGVILTQTQNYTRLLDLSWWLVQKWTFPPIHCKPFSRRNPTESNRLDWKRGFLLFLTSLIKHQSQKRGKLDWGDGG